MEFHIIRSLLTFLFALTILFSYGTLVQFCAATRPLHGDQLFKKYVPEFELLQRGPVPPSDGSPCSHIPGGSGVCRLNEMNVAGRLIHAPTTYPGNGMKLFAGSVENKIKAE